MSFNPLSVFKERTTLTFGIICSGLLLIFFDLLSKFLVVQYLPSSDLFIYSYPYGGIPVFKDFLGIQFSINYVANTGAAWGLFGDHQVLLLWARIILISSLLLYLTCFNKQKSWTLPLTFICAGAIANVSDYFFYGHVVDMLHFILWGYDFPVFNIADAAISVGVGLFFIFNWRDSEP